MHEILKKHKNNSLYIHEGLKLDISYCINELMRKNNITKEEIAKKLDKPIEYIDNILSANFDDITLRELANILTILKGNKDIRIVITIVD